MQESSAYEIMHLLFRVSEVLSRTVMHVMFVLWRQKCFKILQWKPEADFIGVNRDNCDLCLWLCWGGDYKALGSMVVVSIRFELHFFLLAPRVLWRRWETVSRATSLQCPLHLGHFPQRFPLFFIFWFLLDWKDPHVGIICIILIFVSLPKHFIIAKVLNAFAQCRPLFLFFFHQTGH